MKYFFGLIGIILCYELWGAPVALAQTAAAGPLLINISSSKTLSGTAGDYVTVLAGITNSSTKPVSNITTYLSLADESTKLPVDLEDWSAEKGLFIGNIDAQQTLPLNWKIHFVTPGDYALIVVAEAAGQELPQTSAITHFHVNPKRNLNPGEVLPVALGMPIVILFAMTLLAYRRNSELV